MPQALPALAATATIASAVSSMSSPRAPQLPPAPPTLTMEQARQEAQNVLNPLFGEHLKNALKEVDRANIRRGFFGQLPGAALSRSTAADIGTRQQQAIGQLTGQLQGMSAQQAAQHAQLALQSHRQNLMADQARLAGLGAAFQGLGQIRELWPTQWSQWFPGPNPTQTLNAMPGLVAQGYGTTPLPTTTPSPFQLMPMVPTAGTFRLPSMR